MIRKNSPLAKEFWEKGFVESCPVYDMHGHMGTHYAIYFAAPNAPEMVKLINRANVKKLCFSHHFSLWATNYVGQDPALEACKQFPDYLRFYCGINPNFPEQMMADLKKVAEWILLYHRLADYHKVPSTQNPACFSWNRQCPPSPNLFHTWWALDEPTS